MLLGYIGSGNMARALALGLGEPALFTDAGSGKAQALADELGGEALASNAELVERADVVVLAHKPKQLAAVAADAGAGARVIVSILGATAIADIQAAWPGAEVVRAMPNTPVEVREGVTCICDAPGTSPETSQMARELFARVGSVVELPEELMDIGTGTLGVQPAYVSLVAEAQIDAAVERGVPAPLAAEMIVESIAGSAALLRKRGMDTAQVRREVTSPGGTTEKGLAVLEGAGLRAAFRDALAAGLAR